MTGSSRSSKRGGGRRTLAPGARLLATTLAFGFGTTSAHARSPSCDATQRFTLKTGVEVVLLADATLPSVAIVSSIHAGSRDDPPGYAGLAHYVEHLTFREALPFASAFDLYAEAGATEVNATTNADTTDYYAVLPAVQLERGIWIEARRLAVGLSQLEEKPALDERGVVLREHELRFGFVPTYRLLEASLATLYPGQHPYHELLASKGSIGGLTLDDARWFFAQFYRPSRVRLVLVGDFHAEAALRLIERDFGGLEPQSVARAEKTSSELACERWASEVPRLDGSRILLRSRARNERLELYWPVLPEERPEQWRGVFRLLEAELLDAARQLGLARAVEGELVQRELASFWRLSIDLVPNAPFEKLTPLVRKVISSFGEAASDAAELASRRQALELWQALDETRLLGRARNLARRECTPSVCVDPSSALSSGARAQLGRFDPGRALIVERHYESSAPEEGELEKSP